MIRILINDGSLFEFKSITAASNWVQRNAEVYGHDRENLLVISDKPLRDMIVAEAIDPDEVECLIECEGCESILKFSRKEHEVHLRVHCPACGEANKIDIQ